MTEPQLRAAVSRLLKKPVSRTTLKRWRDSLGCDDAWTPEYACVLAVFGRCRGNRKTVEEAKQITKSFCEEHGL